MGFVAGATYWQKSLSKIGRRIGAPGIRLPKLVRNIRKVLGHPTLPLVHFSPFAFILIPALLKRRRALNPRHAAERLLVRSAGSPPAALLVEVLRRIHLGLNRNAGEAKADGNNGHAYSRRSHTLR